MFAVEVRDHVMIAHSFRGAVFGPAQALHGATFVIDVAFIAQTLDGNGIVVCRFAKVFAPPARMALQSAHVAAIVVRRKVDSEPEYQHLCRCDTWEVVVENMGKTKTVTYKEPGK